jgi:oligopeptide transport system substrate-binding protein
MNRRRWMTRTSWLVVLLVLAMIAAACTSSTTTTTEGTATTAAPTTTEGTATTAAPTTTAGPTTTAAMGPTGVVSSEIAEPKSLNPLDDNESEGIAVLRTLFTPLITYDAKTSQPAEGVAESITSDDGGLTWVVKLKPGWTFHDGTPVTAKSFVDAWNYGAYGPNAMKNAGFFADIAGYDTTSAGETETMSGLVVDSDTQFTVTLSQAQSFWNIKLGYAAYNPLPASFYDDPAAFNEAPVGDGPFMMDGVWQHDQAINVKYYDGYQGTKPQIAGIEFRIYADVNTAVSDLEAGNLDIVDAVPPERWVEVQGEVANYATSPSSSINYLGFPMYLPVIGGDEGKNVRAALSMAVDRKLLTQAIFDGTRDPAYDLLSPVIPGYQENVCENWTYNPDKAKELWDAAFPDGFTDTLYVWFNQGAAHDAWISAVTNQWVKNLGIDIEQIKYVQLPWAEYLGKLDAGEGTGPFRLGWGMDYPHPQNYLEIILASWMLPLEGGGNDTYFQNADFDAALKAALAEPDLQKSLPLYQKADEIACENTPLMPVFYGQNQFAWNDPVSGVYVDGFSDVDWLAVTKNG